MKLRRQRWQKVNVLAVKTMYQKVSIKSVARSTRKATRLHYLTTDSRVANQIAAWRAHKNVMLTIPNPDKKNTKERLSVFLQMSNWGYPRVICR